MATVPGRSEESHRLRLCNGDRMMQEEFHRIYCGMPEDYRAELIGGIVFEPSPVSDFHGTSQVDLAYLLKSYSVASPGTRVAADVTLILSNQDEVQPDLVLRVSQECGGKSHRAQDGYIRGAPELVAEIAYSSRAIDLHLKKERYKVAGILEYLVVCLSPKRIYWFDLPSSTELAPDNSGVYRSRVFPGLWIHERALLHSDDELARTALEQGLATLEHQDFVASLTAH